jgi:hypothetical protein
MNPIAHIGVAIDNGIFHVLVRRTGKNPTSATFPSDERGTEMLKSYVDGIREPVRLAIAVSAATIGIALALGELPGREIFLVSPLAANQPSALASFAARPV